jgi:hypothetical protein
LYDRDIEHTEEEETTTSSLEDEVALNVGKSSFRFLQISTEADQGSITGSHEDTDSLNWLASKLQSTLKENPMPLLKERSRAEERATDSSDLVSSEKGGNEPEKEAGADWEDIVTSDGEPLMMGE